MAIWEVCGNKAAMEKGDYAMTEDDKYKSTATPSEPDQPEENHGYLDATLPAFTVEAHEYTVTVSGESGIDYETYMPVTAPPEEIVDRAFQETDIVLPPQIREKLIEKTKGDLELFSETEEEVTERFVKESSIKLGRFEFKIVFGEKKKVIRKYKPKE